MFNTAVELIYLFLFLFSPPLFLFNIFFFIYQETTEKMKNVLLVQCHYRNA